MGPEVPHGVRPPGSWRKRATGKGACWRAGPWPRTAALRQSRRHSSRSEDHGKPCLTCSCFATDR
eukprot:9807875-Lingulodinium_polyedra.AAC.1